MAIKATIVVLLLLHAAAADAAIVVIANNTSGETVDFTAGPYSDFVHFTGTASNVGGSVPAVLNSNGIPDTAVISGNAFEGFAESYTNGNGEISQPDNPYAANVVHGSGSPPSNSRLWFGNWGSQDSAGFNARLPSAMGTLMVYAGGFAGGSLGGGRLTASLGSTTDSATILRIGNGSGPGSWGGLYTVAWQNESVGSELSISLTNIPVANSGNTGLIAAALIPVPEPSPPILLIVAIIGLPGSIRRGGR